MYKRQVQDKFIKGEVVVGQSSGASGTIGDYRPNPVQNIQDLLNYRDPDKVIQHFLTQFRNEFMKTIPEDLADGVDKRNLIKNIKSLGLLSTLVVGSTVILLSFSCVISSPCSFKCV